MNLTAKAVAGLDLAATENDRIFFDANLVGFGLRLRRDASGQVRRSWVIQYRAHGKTRRLLVGNAGTVNCEEARKAARKLLAKVELGGDPQAERVERRSLDERSFRWATAEYLKIKQPKVKAKTYRDVTRYLTGSSYFPKLHSMPVDAVALRDIALALSRIEIECGATTAARAKTTVSAFFSWSTAFAGSADRG